MEETACGPGDGELEAPRVRSNTVATRQARQAAAMRAVCLRQLACKRRSTPGVSCRQHVQGCLQTPAQVPPVEAQCHKQACLTAGMLHGAVLAACRHWWRRWACSWQRTAARRWLTCSACSKSKFPQRVAPRSGTTATAHRHCATTPLSLMACRPSRLRSAARISSLENSISEQISQPLRIDSDADGDSGGDWRAAHRNPRYCSGSLQGRAACGRR